MSISKETIEHVARLSKLSFNEQEIARLEEQLTDIIDLVETLETVETDGIKPTTNVIHDINRYREDVAENGTDRDVLMKNVPEHQDGYIKVPAMLNGGGEE